MARRRFFVEEVRNRQAELHGEDAHHLVRVLRVEKGQRFEISDNRNVYLSEVAEAHKARVVFTVLEKLPPAPAVIEIALLLSLVKFDRFEWALEKGVEAGVSRFVPVIAERSEKGLDRAALKRQARWRRILLEASQQSRRDTLPEIEAPVTFRAALEFPSPTRCLLDEQPGAAALLSVLEGDGMGAGVALLTGPEGGWTPKEHEGALDAGWRPVSLGPQVLRTETAAVIAAGVAMNAYWAKVQGRTPASGGR
jgi:16S rRNA (uracil1498-N3)-methyltransferase